MTDASSIFDRECHGSHSIAEIEQISMTLETTETFAEKLPVFHFELELWK